jgi:hypothetical protein
MRTMLLIVLFFFLFLAIPTLWFEYVQMPKHRKSGVYPEEGKGTMEDVKRLKKQGHFELAVRLYRQLSNTDLRKADKYVRELPTE